MVDFGALGPTCPSCSFRRDHLDLREADFVLGPPGPSFFVYFVFSCRFLFVSVVFNFSCFFFFFSRQMFKRQPLRVLAHSVARSSCSLLLIQELIIPLLFIADLFVSLRLGVYITSESRRFSLLHP